MTTIACIGGGRMGAALVAGWVEAGIAPDAIVVAEPDADARSRIEADLGVRTTETPARAVTGADVVVLAVKPLVLPEVLASTRPELEPGALVLSIVAGVRISDIEAFVPGHPVVRAMPNTPAIVGRAATAIAVGTQSTGEHAAQAEALLASVGLVVRVPEDLLDVVTALSGSGPAYVFLLIEALVAAGVAGGLPPETAAVLVEQTVRGSAELLARSGETPEALRSMVTSPGGTTEAGIAVLDAHGFREVVAAAVAAATQRSHELGDA